MPTPSIQSHSPDTLALRAWRGFGEIWTPETYNLNLRRSTVFEVTAERCKVQMPKKTISFALRSIVEFRMFRLPVPSLTIVFTHGEGYSLVSLFCFPGRRANKLAETIGAVVPDRRTWRTGLEARRDQRRFSLQGAK